MALSQFALSSDTHQKNICTGLTTLQQNGEFVDMTLAADGHFVKVHQIILALGSPYLKELINSADCQHPVIFLNKISVTTLCNILEYIYTGEVLVSVENLNEFIEAGKNLHIKGLEEIKIQDTKQQKSKADNSSHVEFVSETVVTEADDIDFNNSLDETFKDSKVPHEFNITIENDSMDEEIDKSIIDNAFYDNGKKEDVTEDVVMKLKNQGYGTMQYTVSNQGSLQIILNRYLYYMKHTNRNKLTQWRCVDYVNGKRCPAYVMTKGDIVIQRISAHTHPYHDKRILKKYKLGSIFSAIHEAEQEGIAKKQNKSAISSEITISE